MTRIYLDAEALVVQGAVAGVAEPALDPAADRALQFLAEAGHQVVVVALERDAVPPVLRAVATEIVTEVPTRPAARSWYLTTTVERCLGVSARLRTVLIGAAPPPGSVHRCDAVARDVQAAALEILASEAMPQR